MENKLSVTNFTRRRPNRWIFFLHIFSSYMLTQYLMHLGINILHTFWLPGVVFFLQKNQRNKSLRFMNIIVVAVVTWYNMQMTLAEVIHCSVSSIWIFITCTYIAQYYSQLRMQLKFPIGGGLRDKTSWTVDATDLIKDWRTIA